MSKGPAATTGPSRRRGHVALTEVQVATRTFALVLLNFLHRMDEVRREAYEDDLNTAAIGEMVGMIASEPKRRDPEFREKYSDFRVVIGVAGQQPSNALSIANATGMPRETVRRKLQNLTKRGILMKTRGGYIMTPGFIQTPKNLALADRAMREAVHFINECFNFGLVRWVEEPKSVELGQKS
jgi:predicted transcriptional regulator